MDKPISDALEYAILETLMQIPDGRKDADLQQWDSFVRNTVRDSFTGYDLKAAFERLRQERVLRVSKWSNSSLDYVDYSELERLKAHDTFYYSGAFRIEITDAGRKHWDHLRFTRRRKGVFISHITEEKSLAIVLQKYLRLAFADDLQVFVSSDAKSIAGGRKWYTHIIDNLRHSEVVLVLVSQESKAREWINFEAGFGEGTESLVIPLAIKNMSLGQLSFPLAGVQGRTIHNLGDN